MKVLLTGIAGAIGTQLAGELDHEIVGADLVGADGGAWEVLDVADPVAVSALVGRHRPDAVIHLAGRPTEASLAAELDSHVTTTAALLEAMVEHDVTRFVYASSNHAVGRTPREPGAGPAQVGIDTRPRPDTFYGLGKVAAEALCSLYADRFGLDTIMCRIGSFLPEPTTRRNLSTWLSPGDCVRMFEAALTAPSPGFTVLYGTSANTRAWWDLAPGRALGYHPLDDAEQWAEEILAVPETEQDRAEAAFVGGPYATREFERPAF